MLRISLIVAIVAGVGALAITQLKVAKTLDELRTDLQTTKDSLTASQQSEQRAKRESREATAAADKAKKELDTARIDLATASEKAVQQEKRANDLEATLNRTTQERNDAQAELARWKAFEMTIEQIRATIAENKKLVQERNAVFGENKILDRNLKAAQSELAILKGEVMKVPLPPSLKGKVIAVDPKYEFVVLDVGKDDGVLARGEMLVNRSGRLVAKVRILTAEANRSIANVLPEWKQAEIMEGDVVIVGL
jgi:vacuolar-type H+-ATPase subunit I/STV1